MIIVQLWIVSVLSQNCLIGPHFLGGHIFVGDFVSNFNDFSQNLLVGVIFCERSLQICYNFVLPQKNCTPTKITRKRTPTTQICDLPQKNMFPHKNYQKNQIVSVLSQNCLIGPHFLGRHIFVGDFCTKFQ